MRRHLPTVTVLLLLLLAPATAQAQRAQAPPGSAGIQQYMETIPEATGDRRARSEAPGGDEQVVDAATRRRLEAAGPDGKELVAALERAGTPVRSTSGGGTTRSTSGPDHQRNGSADSTADTTTTAGGSGAAAVVRALAEPAGGGMGIALPLLLLGSLVAAVAIGRRRRT